MLVCVPGGESLSSRSLLLFRRRQCNLRPSAAGADDLPAGGLGSGVVPIVVGHGDRGAGLPGKYVEVAVVLLVEHFASHEGADAGIIVYSFKISSLLRIIVVEADDVEGGAALILLAQAEVVPLYVDEVVLVVKVLLDVLEAFRLPLQPLLAQLMQFFLVLIVR